jgi:hypothetical protein
MASGFQAYSQKTKPMDPGYSAYNYKHPNKAAYAKEHNLDEAITVGVVQVTQNENYKQGNSQVTSNKLGVVSNGDNDKVYPNYKRPQINTNDQEERRDNSSIPQIAKKKRGQKNVSPEAESYKGKN